MDDRSVALPRIAVGLAAVAMMVLLVISTMSLLAGRVFAETLLWEAAIRAARSAAIRVPRQAGAVRLVLAVGIGGGSGGGGSLCDAHQSSPGLGGDGGSGGGGGGGGHQSSPRAAVAAAEAVDPVAI